jgi:urease accessory protein
MLVADEFLGTLADSDVATRVENADGLTVTLDDTERRRSRVRTTADDGTDVGVVVGRELHDGDVLAADSRPVVVSLEPVEALVLEFADVDADATVVMATLELGHAVGNRHWDLATEGEQAYLPIDDARERMRDEVDGILPDGVTVGFDAVSPALFDDATPEHDHAHGADGGHAHEHAHGPDERGHATDHAVQSLDPEGSERS